MNWVASDWVFVGAGAAVGAAGAVLLLWALFWDRARGRRRCPKCWYDMAGVPGLLCPECGREAGSEGQLRRTRRRWRWAVVGLMVGVVSPGMLALVLGRNGVWVRYAPTTILVMLVDPHELHYNPVWDPMSKELHARIRDHGLREWQSQILIDRVLGSDPEESRGFLRTRSRWPADTPVVVSGSPDLGFFFDTGWDTAAVMRARLLSTASGEPGSWSRPGGPYLCHAVELGLAGAGGANIRVEAELSTSRQVLWRGVRELRCDRSRSGDEVLKPVSGLDKDVALAAWLRPALWVEGDRLSLGVHDRGREAVLGSYVALGFHARLLHRGETVAETDLVLTPPLARSCGNEPDTTAVYLRLHEPIADAGAASGWVLELTGDRTLALRDYDQYGWGKSIETAGDRPWQEPTTYWSGFLRIPVEATVVRSR